MVNYEDLPENIKELADKCNPKHVRVVQAILSGEFSSNTKAYQSVYPESANDSAKASVAQILTLANVSALHSALRDESLLSGIISRAEAMKILSDMASAGMDDLVVFGTYEAGYDEDGEPVFQSAWKFKDSENMTKKALRSIHELTATPQGLKLKMHDQKAAIKQLAEMAGWETPKTIKHEGIPEVNIYIPDNGRDD